MTDQDPHHQPDVVIIGGGTFGCVLAWQLTAPPHPSRVLLLDAGGFDRIEHVQTPPAASLGVPAPRGGDATRDDPVWSLPWQADGPSHGIAYCVGGRSLYWGAFCAWPHLRTTGAGAWPTRVATDLNERYLPQAAVLLGLTVPPGHLHQALHATLSRRLLDALRRGRLPGLLAARDCPEHPAALADAALADPNGPLRLSLPMAMRPQGNPPVPHRFSAAALLAQHLRTGAPLEVRTGCRVTRLHTDAGRIVALDTTRGRLDVAATTPVVMCAGTVENTRLILDHAGPARLAPGVGQGLLTHLRSNLTVRMPPPGPSQPFAAWGTAALLLRGARHAPGGSGYTFHHQITAYPAGPLTPDMQRMLLDSTPRTDIQSLPASARTPVCQVILTVASVGEMSGEPGGQVTLLPDRCADGTRRAKVAMRAGPQDELTWNVMDRSAREVISVLAAGTPWHVLRPAPAPAGRRGDPVADTAAGREPLGCVHHEMGSLGLGTGPTSATDTDCRVRGIANLYATAPAVFPTLDSAGPVLPGVAMTLRLADHLRHRPVTE